MREAVREIIDDLPEAVLTAAAIALFLGIVIGGLIVLATPIPDILQ